MNTGIRRTWIASLLLGLATPGSHAEVLERFEFVEPHMGTLFRIKLYAKDEDAALSAAMEAFKRIDALNSVFSDYDADSEVMRLVENYEAGKPVAASKELCDAVALARRISKITEGAFDITMGRHTWNWRMARRTGNRPEVPTVERARAATGFEKLRIRPNARTLTFTVPGMRLDFGGIAKGIAADAALAILKERGIARALVAGGGDVALGDPPPGKKGWETGIELNDGRERVRLLSNCGISTSGDSEQSVVIDGERYSHIVDPRTGLGLTHRIGATVIASCASLSDPLATAICVLNPDDPETWAKRVPGVTIIVAGK